MIRCIAIDDEPLALKLIEQHVSQFEDVSLARTFTDAVEALDFIGQHPPDVVILDINMPDLNGLELAGRLHAGKPLIIFTTAYRDYALEGFQLDAVDYLLKPVTFERFETAIQKVRQRAVNAVPDASGFLTVHSEYKLLKIPLADIEYIESLSDYVKIYRQGEIHPILSLNSLKLLKQRLPASGFSRIHRSFIVGHHHISALKGRKVLLKSGRELPVSKGYEQFLKAWRGAGS